MVCRLGAAAIWSYIEWNKSDIKIEWNKSIGKPFAAKGLQGSRAGWNELLISSQIMIREHNELWTVGPGP